MKRVLLVIIVLFSCLGFGQNNIIADDYFKRGEFVKALSLYQKLYESKKSSNYLYKIAATLQQLERYQEAQELLFQKKEKSKSPVLSIEIGYNYRLQDSLTKADYYFNDALDYIEEKSHYAYSVARKFEEHSLQDYAIKAYTKGMELQPDKNYNIQLARIYGDQGNIELMFSSYIDYLENKPSFLNNAKRAFSDFVSENSDNESNIALRRLLIQKLQLSPETYWYELLSWLYVQEKAFNKSFVQEKALYMRNPESLDRIIELAVAALDQKEYETSERIFSYVLENSQDISTLLTAHQYSIDIKTETYSEKDYGEIDKVYNQLFETFGTYRQTLSLQLSYGNFLAFYLKKPEEGSAFLKQTLDLAISPFQEASVKLKLADILVFQEKFNEALIYYTQIQANLKNSTIAQEARFKVAKTSYYKGDFDWAESQLKILKASTSQLIANDALDLKLLISDNKQEDSLRTALKLYAKADLMAYQNNSKSAIDALEQILTEHKGESITDQALYKQAKLFEKEGKYENAAANYQQIIADYREDILADDAHYYLAELYNNILGKPEDAKPLYEKIIFEHEDSIYFVEARKAYRKLRGDAIN
ncbi:tetratricopeptide repeat protein [Ichthyenterobacterium sp. W332]|uniref:Tetratricopeptide repeat protein n=1 Tax=Microcosmobacter mediterraneus TaxID=3075607 RepID=A0ABU2YIF0_9FLAO|nr:tetratricopeptide repeat protein [Ichthyenterobacterium sp. W332]MDT0557926.1 tetratricopeptide repeat protein [Ichthyenterobacterium sp. W332]